MTKPKTWIVIADGQRARILQRCRTADQPHLENALTHEWINAELLDKPLHDAPPGKMGTSAARGRSTAMAERDDKKRQIKQAFAGELAAHLAQAATRGDVTRMIVIAAPRTLGDLRTALSGSMSKLVAAWIDKDLTHASPDEVMAHLDACLPVSVSY